MVQTWILSLCENLGCRLFVWRVCCLRWIFLASLFVLVSCWVLLSIYPNGHYFVHSFGSVSGVWCRAVSVMANSRKRPREVDNLDEINWGAFEPCNCPWCCKSLSPLKRQKKPFLRWKTWVMGKSLRFIVSFSEKQHEAIQKSRKPWSLETLKSRMHVKAMRWRFCKPKICSSGEQIDVEGTNSYFLL